MVISALEELRNVQYPEFLVRRWDDEIKNETSWVIKDPAYSQDYYALVRVKLEFDQTGKPLNFNCYGNNQNYKANLDNKSLIPIGID